MTACPFCASPHNAHQCRHLPADIRKGLNADRYRRIADIDCHGTNTGYRGYGCRCRPCTAAASRYRAGERRNQRLQVAA